ncbi:MAG TPA: hypothetical protein PKX56_03485 [Marmoricola sp.]|nr:hypothetical protein [Marmoricola sp.]HNJ78395.1 hypothetical protein [Marmoricola sp.]HNN47646.1 hypothetical protein [Marmoricola sp.]
MAPKSVDAVASTQRQRLRIPPTIFLLPGGLALLAGLDAGLLLAGLPTPVDRTDLTARHGMLMVLGFLGTLIALERAVALRQPWGLLAPGCLGLGGIALMVGAPQWLGALLLVNGCLALVVVYSQLFARQRDEATAVEMLGAVAALAGAALWFRLDIPALLPWLVTFILFTITAERVELARLHRPPGSERTLLWLSVVVMAGALSTLLLGEIGARLFGATVLILTLWSANGDVARKTIRLTGLPRFSAAALLLGYFWLACGSLIWLIGGTPGSISSYDAAVHTVFLGFAMSMVIAHAPVILPAVIRRPLPYHPSLWVTLFVLQIGLIIRVGIGDGLGNQTAWDIGIWITVAALLLLPITAIALVIKRPSPRRQ